MPGPTDNARMFAEVYDELRRIARRYYRGNAADYTLQPTALVNEAFTKIVGQRNVDPSNRAQFLGVAAHILRNKLIDYQRRRRALARGGGVVHVEIDDQNGPVELPDIDLLALRHALERLETVHERQASVVDLKYFLGLTNEEVAQELGISVATVKTDWTIAKLFLLAELESGERSV